MGSYPSTRLWSEITDVVSGDVWLRACDIARAWRRIISFAGMWSCATGKWVNDRRSKPAGGSDLIAARGIPLIEIFAKCIRVIGMNGEVVVTVTRRDGAEEGH
jgi:hypothetical protein